VPSDHQEPGQGYRQEAKNEDLAIEEHAINAR
jgi:hypothetical protein